MKKTMSSLDTLSYTTSKLLKECPRKYFLTYVNHFHEEMNVHFSFGRAVGAGIATALLKNSLFEGYKALLLAYDPYISSEKKNLTSAARALQTLWEFWHNEELHLRYEPIAMEQNFKIHILSNLSYIGHLDLHLRDRLTKKPGVLDVKTTQWNRMDLRPVWQNSSQVTLYGAALLTHQGVSWEEGFNRLYLVAQIQQSGAIKPHFYSYPTSEEDVTEAIQSMISDLNNLLWKTMSLTRNVHKPSSSKLEIQYSCG